MSRLKMFVMAVVAVCALSAVVVSTAAATKCPEKGASKCLPLIHVLEKESFPLLLEAVTKGTESSKLETAAGAKLTAEELKLLLDMTELSSLGTFDAHFTGTKEAGAEKPKPCTTEGDSEGTVLVKGEFHLVYSSTEPLSQPLLLLLVPVFTLVCKNEASSTTIKTEGSLLSELKTGASGEDVKSVGSKTLCKAAGVQELSTYLNDKEEAVKASLKSTLGGKLQSVCEQVNANPFTANVKELTGEATMFNILW